MILILVSLPSLARTTPQKKKKKKSSIKSFLTVDENLVKENAALRQRIQELEQQIEQLKKGVCASTPAFLPILFFFFVDQTWRMD